MFEFISTFYQTGKMKFPTELDPRLIEKELEYWGLQPKKVEPTAKRNDFVPIPNTIKARIHLFLVDPSSTTAAGIWAGVDIVFITVSIVSFILETEPAYNPAFTNPDHVMYPFLYWMDVCIAGFFSIDLIIRAITWPSVKGFVTNGQNIVDFLSLLPFYAQLFMSKMAFFDSGRILRLFRIFRVIKLFKLVIYILFVKSNLL